MAYKRGSGKTGRVNMKRVDGGWVNKHEVFFTDEERKNLERANRRSNKVREQMLKKEAEIMGADRQAELSDLRTMGKESIYSISKQDKNLQSFKSLEDYERYMDKQAGIQTGEYQLERARLYKRNFINSLLETYGDEAQDIAMKVRMMKPDEYMMRVAGDEVLEIRFVPSDRKVAGRLNQLRAHLGMKLKPEWPDEIDE